MRGRPLTHWLVGVLVLGAVLRFSVFLAAVSHPGRFWSPDDHSYLPIANHLSAAYGSGPGRLFNMGLQRTPVYPLFLRGVFDVFGYHYAAAVGVQIVLSLATIVLVFWTARRIVSEKLALVAALLVAIDPASILFTNQMMTETVFTFFVAAAVALIVVAWERSRLDLAACAGLLLGLATLTRPVSTYLPIVLLPALLLPRPLPLRRLAALAAALVVGFALPVGGWIVRNHHVTGVATVSTIDGLNMLEYRAVGALMEEGVPFHKAEHEARSELAAKLPAHPNAAQVSSVQLRVGARILLHHPKGAVKTWAKGEMRLLVGPAKAELAILLTGHKVAHASWLRALQYLAAVLTAVLVLGGAAGLLVLLAGPKRSVALWVMATIIVYLVVISGGPEAYSRFRVPITPLLAVFASLGLARLLAHRSA